MNYHHYDYSNPTSQRILQEFEHRHASVFEQAKTRWNVRTREFLREIIRVRLLDSGPELYGGKAAPIPVAISLRPDNNGQFLRLVDAYYPRLDFLEFIRMRAFLDAAAPVQPDFQHPEAPTAAFAATLEYARQVAGRFQLEEVISTLFTQMFQEGNDVFGSYFLRESRIELYYVPLLVFATLRQLGPAALYAVILAHELTHAYTHVGRDIDGRFWQGFAHADLYVAEGLAQYYTERFVQHYPELEPAYRTLLAAQSGPYLAHQGWHPRYDHETVRRTLIETRRHPQPLSLPEFEAHLVRTQRGSTAPVAQTI